MRLMERKIHDWIVCSDNLIILTEAGAYPQLPKQPIFLIIFKLVQQSIVVIRSIPVRSCLAKKKMKFELEEKKFSLLLKVSFSRQKRLQTSLSVIN